MAFDHKLLFQKVRTAIQERGILAVARQVLDRLQTADDGFDSGRGTDTGGIIELWRLNIDGENKKYGVHYQPTLEAELRDAISFAVRERRDFVFVDLGCGKGKTLLIAADMGFARIIGVDFAEKLVEIASKNLKSSGVSNAIVIKTDVACFEFPTGPLLVYMYNPFGAEVMRSVLANLLHHEDELFVVYNQPKCAAELDSCLFLERVGSVPGRPKMVVWKQVKSR